MPNLAMVLALNVIKNKWKISRKLEILPNNCIHQTRRSSVLFLQAEWMRVLSMVSGSNEQDKGWKVTLRAQKTGIYDGV
jgi:hypothetical protein